MAIDTITVIAADTWWTLTPGRRADLRDWMRANNLPAHNIAAGEEVFIEGNTVTFTEILRTPDGKAQTTYDENGELRILAEERTIPLVSWPAEFSSEKDSPCPPKSIPSP